MRFELFNFSERALEQWKNYDELFDNLTHWLGETENKLKEHTELQGSLEDKEECATQAEGFARRGNTL